MRADALPVEQNPEEPWATRLGHVLWEVSAITGLLHEAALADTSLSPASQGLLDQVIATPGITIAEMARRTPTSAQGIGQVMHRLEKLGFIERRIGSGRGVGLHPTPAGRAAQALGTERELEVDAAVRERLGGRRYEELRRLLAESRALLTDSSDELRERISRPARRSADAAGDTRARSRRAGESPRTAR